jgi:hypothetical protein
MALEGEYWTDLLVSFYEDDREIDGTAKGLANGAYQGCNHFERVWIERLLAA